MVRPGHRADRKRQREGGEKDEAGDGPGDRRVLPVAELPEGFDGDPEDGAMYLALAHRANAGLPFTTRVSNPFRAPSPPLPTSSAAGLNAPEAGPSRHPALPKDSWTILFPIHFKAYRKHLSARFPPDHPMPYPEDWPPFPSNVYRNDVYGYINGYRRIVKAKKAPNAKSTGGPPGSGAGNSRGRGVGLEGSRNPSSAPSGGRSASSSRKIPVRPLRQAELDMLINDDDISAEEDLRDADDGDADGDEDPAAGRDDDNQDPGDRVAMDVEDEETAMNSALFPGHAPPTAIPEHPPENRYAGAESAKHDCREPLVSAIQHLNSIQITTILSHIATWTSETIDQLPSFLPTQPGFPSLLPTSRDAAKPLNPFPDLYARWVFVLLSVLDEHLSGDQISALRELARAAMKVGGWRWIKAVTEGEVSHVDTEEDGGPGGGGSDGPSNGVTDSGGSDAGVRGTAASAGAGAAKEGRGWKLGSKWKIARDAHPTPIRTGDNQAAAREAGDAGEAGEAGEADELGLDETLARCWMVVYAVAAGWAQWDLVTELEDLFA